MAKALTPDLLLAAYAHGIFPMARSRDDPTLHWVDPRLRGILPIDGFHISRSLARRLRRDDFTATANSAFDAVVAGCAAREETWINGPLTRVYAALHGQGRAHSVEVWQDGMLAGGVFGVSLGGAFFAESMFSQRTDASKAALAWLVDRLAARGFSLIDTQFLTPHLETLGGINISRADYRARLARALEQVADFGAPGPLPPAHSIVQRRTQMS